MTKRIVIVRGHPDPKQTHFCHALADAYGRGAADAGHEVRRIAAARLNFPVLRTKGDATTQRAASRYTIDHNDYLKPFAVGELYLQGGR